MAREFTGRSEVISLRNSYHGGTHAAMGLTAHSSWKFPSNPASPVKNATPGYCYRCPYGLTYPSCDVRCARDVEPLIRYETSGEPACFIGEPIQGGGGHGDPAARVFSDHLRHGAPLRWFMYCRRGANRLWPHRRAFLGV